MPAASKKAEVKRSKIDIYGVISLILALGFVFFGLALIGIVVGIIGAHIAKKQKRNPILSRIGWVINLVEAVFEMYIVLEVASSL